MMTMMVALAAFLFSANDTPGELPTEIAHLSALAGQESALADAVRKFDREQTALAVGELAQAKRHARAGEKEAAEAKQQEAVHRFELMKQAYEFGLQQYPNNARMQNYYGELLYDRFGQFDGAIKAWQLAIALDPKLSAPYNNLAIHCCHVGEYERGLKYYDEALRLDPENPDYLYNVAQMYLVNSPQVQKIRKWDQGKLYKEAMKLSKKAAKLAPTDYDLVSDYALNFFAAENFGVKANWKEAAKAWERAQGIARTDGERVNVWVNQGRAWTRAGDKTKARACFEEALKLEPNSEVTRKLLIDLGQETPPKASAPRGKIQSEQ